METTNFKNPVKVSQIISIMQEHFRESVNLARIKLISYTTNGKFTTCQNRIVSHEV